MPKTKSIPPKGCLFYFRFRIFPGKSNLSFFPIIPVFFPMKHFSKKRQSFNRLSFLLLFSAGFFFQYFFPIFRPGIGMLPHPLTAVCLSFLYAGNRNISPCFRDQGKNRLPCPCKNFSGIRTGNFFRYCRNFLLLFHVKRSLSLCIFQKAYFQRCPEKLCRDRISFSLTGKFPCSPFSIRQFSLRRKNPDILPEAVHCSPFPPHSTLQKQESEAVPGRTFLTKYLSGNQNR